MQRIGIGRTAEVYRDEDGSAVKLFYEWMPASEAEKEAEILQKVSAVFKRAPKYFELHRLEGRSGLRFEFIDGEMAAKQMLSQPLQALRLSRELGRLHHEIHSSETAELRPGEEIFSAGLQAYPGIDDADRSRLLTFLNAHSGRSLCHGDFHPENVLIEPGGSMRVIDWVNAYSGDPLSDVARSYYLMRYGRSPQKRTLSVSILEAIAKPLIANAYLKGYFEKETFTRKEFRLWLLIIMICRFRDRITEEEKQLRKMIRQLLKTAVI